MTLPSERPPVEDRPPVQRDLVSRLLGGPAISVLLRLVLLSILIGVILEVMGLDPRNIFESLRTLLERVWGMGFDALRWLWRYLLLGAAVVVPIWVIVRLLRATKGQ